jgi:hypothetical protein
MKKLILITLCVLSLNGCVASNLNLIETGMNKKQVLEIMGDPITTSTQQECEYMIYGLYDSNLNYRSYFVRLINGRVEAFGCPGAFNSTRVPEHTQNINVTYR